MSVISDSKLEGILNEADDRSFQKRIQDRTSELKQGVEGVKNNLDKNLWYKNKGKKSPNKITFKEDSEGNVIDCHIEGLDEGDSVKDKINDMRSDLTVRGMVSAEKERQDWESNPGAKTGELIGDIATGGNIVNTAGKAAGKFVGSGFDKIAKKVIDKREKERKKLKEDAEPVYRSKEFTRAMNEYFDITDTETRKVLLAVNEADQNKVLVSLTSKLYDNVVDRVDDIDFGEIERTKGDIEKLPNFDTLHECLNTMAKLLIEFKQDTKPVDTIAQCVSNLIESKGIWTKAYAVNAELPIVTYNTMVLAVIEATSYMVSMCVDFVKSPSQDTMQILIDKSALTKSKGHMLFKNIESFNDAYRKGQVEKAMMHIINDNAAKKNFLGFGLYTGGAVAAAVIGLAGLLFCIIPIIRELIFLFFYYRVRVSEFFDLQSDLLQVNAYNVENSRLDLPKEERKKISAKQIKVADNFRSIARKIAVDGAAAEKNAIRDVKIEDSKKYKASDIMEELPDSASSALF